MGYYLEGDVSLGKAEFLVKNHNARIVTRQEASQPAVAVVVCHNPMFDAAGICFDRKEFEAFTEPIDMRRKTFLLMKKTDCLAKFEQDYPNQVKYLKERML